MRVSTGKVDLGRSSILLVDDSVPSLDLMQQILSGFRAGSVKACSDPEEARDIAMRSRFDLLIIDGEMTDVDGIEMARYVRSQADFPNFSAPIILVSAHTPKGKVVKARDAGVNLVVKKPLSPAALMRRIQWLGRNDRPFVVSTDYCGPDRRIKKMPPPADVGERRAHALALTSNVERPMSQDDIDSLFG